MGHFDIVAAVNFRKTADGRVIFQPWGVYGRGYEVPTKKKYDETRTFMKNFFIAAALLGGFGALVGVWLTVLLVVPGMCVAYRVRIMSLTQGLAEVEQTGPLSERIKKTYRRQAAMSSFARLWLLLIGVVFFFVMWIAILLSHPEARGDPGMLILIVVFGVCVVAAGYMIWLKRGLVGKPDPPDLP